MRLGVCMLGKLPFRSKLILVVSVPLFALVGFAGVTINSRFDALTKQQQYGHLLPTFDALTYLGRAAADEGAATPWFAQAPPADRPAAKALITDTRAATDDAARALQQSAPELGGRVSSHTLTTVHGVTNRLHALLKQARALVDAHRDPGPTLSDLAARAASAAAAVARDVPDRDLSTGLLGVVNLRRGQIAAAAEGSIITSWLLNGRGDVTAWDAAIHDQNRATSAFFDSATQPEADAYTKAVTPAALTPLRTDGAALPTAFPPTPLSVDDYQHLYLAQRAQTDRGINRVQTTISQSAATKETDARNLLVLAAGSTALLIGIVLLLAWALVRSVNKPLRALTRAARNMSERRLPQLVDTLRAGGELSPGQLEELTPIRVPADDEIGALARAFSTIQQVAVAVAEEQAALLRKGIGDLYVNLARRNQSLLDRQLAIIDDLESRAGEPDELATLFELDQLATRMRRNAESLLVLAGSDQPRQWRTAIPVIDVVRAAAAEIADFARVNYFGFGDDLAVAGHAVADVTHLLAELLENATSFSPPTAPVIVAGRPHEHRYVITITDEGIGVDEEKLRRANALLIHPPAPGLSLSRTLGLHVVAHLAARHGIHIQLRPATGTGVAAVIALPATILTHVVDTPDPTAPAPPWVSGAPFKLEPVPESPTPKPRPPWADPAPTQPVGPAPVPAASSTGTTPAPTTADTPPDGDLPRRVPTPATSQLAPGLTARIPGTHLSHRPPPDGPPAGEPRPRPDRVHDLLTRHARGVREGQNPPPRDDEP
jgi:signal transduction histidine kinase